jgi:hypothetical protein
VHAVVPLEASLSDKSEASSHWALQFRDLSWCLRSVGAPALLP